jgi:DNA-binding CsgD family transcriptional regulator
MFKSNRLQLGDVEAVFRLVNECREMWADADAWREHLLRGACRLTGTAVGFYGEAGLSADGREMRVLHQTALGFRDAAAKSHFERFAADYSDPMKFLPGMDRLAAAAPKAGHAVALRPELCPDREWYGSSAFNEYRRPAYNDGFIAAVTISPPNRLSALTVNQDLSDPPPTPRAAVLLSLLHRQIVPLIGTVMATDRQRGLHGLSPRLRQVLEALLSGAAEKQVAARLALSPATVHEYVAALHHHFGVNSRGELLANFVHRRPSGPDA